MIADVDEGVKAIFQGEALITVRLKQFTHTCKINVMSKEEDEAIPIRFNNNFFTKELYKKVKGIEVYGIDPFFDDRNISFVSFQLLFLKFVF